MLIWVGKYNELKNKRPPVSLYLVCCSVKQRKGERGFSNSSSWVEKPETTDRHHDGHGQHAAACLSRSPEGGGVLKGHRLCRCVVTQVVTEVTV